jgi:uncharacterized iron-regulated membrane protein
MKKFFRTIHLYLSLVAGVFIVLATVTGCIMVFEDEINNTFYTERYFVEPASQKLPITELISIAEKETKGAKASGLKIYKSADRSVEISLMAKEGDNKDKQAKTEEKKGRKPGFLVYINPYTAEIISTIKSGGSFFKKVEMIHRFLLSKKGGIGNYVMSYSSMFFLFILVTGVILWWPKSNKILKQRLKVKWDGKTKRLVHDLHVVLGFYTSIFLIVIVSTGLIMAFPAVNSIIFKLTKSKTESPKPPKSNFVSGVEPLDLASLTQLINKISTNWESYNFRLPKEKDDVISVNVLEEGALENKVNTYYFDQYTGEKLGALLFADRSLGQRIRSYVKPIHKGELLGLPTKILSFIISLLTITFPITGVIMWLNRLKKTKDVAN